MSQQTLKMRMAEIRRSWSRKERETRAILGERRCVEFLFQTGMVRPHVFTAARAMA